MTLGFASGSGIWRLCGGGGGCPRLTDVLRTEGFVDNHKRIERIYRQEKLQVRRRRRKRLAPGTERKPIPILSEPRERWSMDFVRCAGHGAADTGPDYRGRLQSGVARDRGGLLVGDGESDLSSGTTLT
jgi:hypothetical protein